MKKTLLIFIAIIGTALIFVNCGGESTKNTDKKVESTVQKDEPAAKVEKTRDELIINRTQMTYADPDNPSDFELKHTPEITFGEKDSLGLTKIYVKIGSNGIVHPSTPEHWIDYMTLFLDGAEHAHIDQPNDENSNHAEFSAPLDDIKTVKVEIGCNLHGIWSNTVEVEN